MRIDISNMERLTLAVCLFLQCLHSTIGLPAIFYPFGIDHGDEMMTKVDNDYTDGLDIDIGFPFFQVTRSRIDVSTNGVITFDQGDDSNHPEPFPLQGLCSAAVYWADINVAVNDGLLYFRISTDTRLLATASKDIRWAFARQGFSSFQAKWVFVATWHDVTYFGGSSTSPIQSFQAVMITNGTNSFALYNYGELSWLKSEDSENNDPQVGFNAGDGINYYAAPWSGTADVLKLGTTSNIGKPGRWAFRIDSVPIMPGQSPGRCRKFAYYLSHAKACRAYGYLFPKHKHPIPGLIVKGK